MGQDKLNLHSTGNEAMGTCFEIRERMGLSVSSLHPNRELYIPRPSLIRMLRDFLGIKSATFKTPEQAEVLDIVMAGDRHLLLVGPTAMGKSLVYMLPAAQRDYGIACVLLPLSALHMDFERRCRDLKLESSRWPPAVNEQPRTKIVYVSPEHTQTSKFVNYLIHMSRLDRASCRRRGPSCEASFRLSVLLLGAASAYQLRSVRFVVAESVRYHLNV